ncbi:MAG: hypothetical protein NVS4B13_03440 [Candidatus Elarobacter sp.]
MIVLVVGIMCLGLGALLGWFAARQGNDAMNASTSATGAAQSAKSAASAAATAAEGWAHVANGAYTLAKFENATAQAAKRRALEAAAKAEKAAARADAVAARAARDRQAFDTARVATAQPLARPQPRSERPVQARPVHTRPVQTRPVQTRPVARAPDEGCRRAIIFERTAARGSISREAAYNAAMSGFAMNAHCAEPQHSLIEAYLLAQRASAEAALHLGDWKADLEQSDRLLARCVGRPEYRAARDGCRKRLRKNEQIRRTLLRG